MWVSIAVWQPCELLYTCYLLMLCRCGCCQLVTGSREVIDLNLGGGVETTLKMARRHSRSERQSATANVSSGRYSSSFSLYLPNNTTVYTSKKVKVAHTRLQSVGFRSWSWFFAVSMQVTWVINPAVVCRYFPPGPHLPSQHLRELLPVSLLSDQRHNGCEQFA